MVINFMSPNQMNVQINLNVQSVPGLTKKKSGAAKMRLKNWEAVSTSVSMFFNNAMMANIKKKI